MQVRTYCYFNYSMVATKEEHARVEVRVFYAS